MEIKQYNTMMKSLRREKKLEEALKKIHHEVTNDIAGLPRDEALNIITWVAETADAALRQEDAT